MPSIEFELANQQYTFAKSPKEYMMLPFIQYKDQDQTMCMLAISNGADYNDTNDITNPLIIGQRFLATSPFFFIVYRSTN